MLKNFTLAGLLTTLAISPAAAQVTLQHKLKPGDTFKTATEVTSKQTLVLNNMEIESGGNQSQVVVSTVGPRAIDNAVEVKNRIEHLKQKMIVQGMELEFDSNKPDAEPAGTQLDMFLDLLKVMAKRQWTTVHNQKNELIDIKGIDEFLKGLDNESLREMVSAQFEKDYLLRVGRDAYQKIPSKPLQVGDQWQQDELRRMEGGQRMAFKTRYTYDGTVDRDGRTLHKISAKLLEVDLSVDPNNANQLDITDSKLKVASSSGHILFDAEGGYTVEETQNANIKGTFTLSVGGTDLPAEIALELAISIKRQ